jgi:hypothetical protein
MGVAYYAPSAGIESTGAQVLYACTGTLCVTVTQVCPQVALEPTKALQLTTPRVRYSCIST